LLFRLLKPQNLHHAADTPHSNLGRFSIPPNFHHHWESSWRRSATRRAVPARGAVEGVVVLAAADKFRAHAQAGRGERSPVWQRNARIGSALVCQIWKWFWAVTTDGKEAVGRQLQIEEITQRPERPNPTGSRTPVSSWSWARDKPMTRL